MPRANTYAEIADMLPEFRKMATEAGRDPKSIEITVWGPKQDADLMKRYEDLGVSRVVFNLESEKADTHPAGDRFLGEADAAGPTAEAACAFRYGLDRLPRSIALDDPRLRCAGCRR